MTAPNVLFPDAFASDGQTSFFFFNFSYVCIDFLGFTEVQLLYKVATISVHQRYPVTQRHIFTLSQILFPRGSSHNTGECSLCAAAGSCWPLIPQTSVWDVRCPNLRLPGLCLEPASPSSPPPTSDTPGCRSGQSRASQGL